MSAISKPAPAPAAAVLICSTSQLLAFGVSWLALPLHPQLVLHAHIRKLFLKSVAEWKE
jgi:hypothetical protein